MKINNFAFFILLLLSFAGSAQNYKSTSSCICWQEGVKLRWSDFQSQENLVSKESSLFNASGANAVPGVFVRSITDSIRGNHYVVNVLFDRSKSWVRDSSTSAPILLIHEQLHFDIAELFGRKLRLKISKAHQDRVDIFSTIFYAEIEKLLDELDKMQDKYDTETAHSLNIEEQTKWGIYIKYELAKLNAFKSTSSICQQ